MASAEVLDDAPCTLYVLARKWWELYANSSDYSPPSSNIITAPQVTLSFNNQVQGCLQWNIEIDADGKLDALDYIVLDPEQWKKFCKWYNGGPVLKPKSSRGISFQYDGEILGFNGRDHETADMNFDHVLNPFVLGHAGGICATVPEVLHKFSGSVIPLKVHTKGVWPDDTPNALPNACEIAGGGKKENVTKKRSGAAGDATENGARRGRRFEAQFGNLACAVIPAGITNLGATCYMNAAFQFLLRPLSETHYNQVKEMVNHAPQAVILKDFVEVWRLLRTNNLRRGGRGRRRNDNSAPEPIRLTDELIPTLRREWAEKNYGVGAVLDDSRTEDAQEFMQFIFQKVLYQHGGDLCLRTFGVIDSQVLNCRNCGEIHQLRDKPYEGLLWMLGISFPDDNRAPMTYMFEDLLRRRCEGDKVERICSQCGRADNMWSCSNLYLTSEFLILCFGRAVLDERRINHRINGIPEELDTRVYFRVDRVDESRKYKLCGVMDHVMGTVGHFVTSLVHDHSDPSCRRWFEFNDEVVSVINDFQINPHNVYMLMYKQL